MKSRGWVGRWRSARKRADSRATGCIFLFKMIAKGEHRKNKKTHNKGDGDDAQGDIYDVEDVITALWRDLFWNMFFDYDNASIAGVSV